MDAQGGADEFVRGRGRVRGCEEVSFVCGVKRICEGEPGAERLVIGRFDAYVVGFKCCGYEKKKKRYSL